MESFDEIGDSSDSQEGRHPHQQYSLGQPRENQPQHLLRQDSLDDMQDLFPIAENQHSQHDWGGERERGSQLDRNRTSQENVMGQSISGQIENSQMQQQQQQQQQQYEHMLAQQQQEIERQQRQLQMQLLQLMGESNNSLESLDIPSETVTMPTSLPRKRSNAALMGIAGGDMPFNDSGSTISFPYQQQKQEQQQQSQERVQPSGPLAGRLNPSGPSPAHAFEGTIQSTYSQQDLTDRSMTGQPLTAEMSYHSQLDDSLVPNTRIDASPFVQQDDVSMSRQQMEGQVRSRGQLNPHHSQYNFNTMNTCTPSQQSQIPWRGQQLQQQQQTPTHIRNINVGVQQQTQSLGASGSVALPMFVDGNNIEGLQKKKQSHAFIHGGYHPMHFNPFSNTQQYPQMQTQQQQQQQHMHTGMPDQLTRHTAVFQNSFISQQQSSEYTCVRILQLDQAMEQTMKTQRLIQDWDAKMGLRRCHSKTMRKSSESRKKVQQIMVSTVMRGGVGAMMFLPKQA